MADTRDLIRTIRSVVNSLRSNVNAMVARVVVNAINDGAAIQAVTVTALADESLDSVQHMQQGGLSHVSLPGAEGLMLCLGGSREAPFVFAVSNRSVRPTGSAGGETVLYAAEKDGVQARLKVGGPLEVTSAGGPTADDFVAMAGKIDTIISTLDTMFRTGWVVVPTDGGAALKAAYLAAFSSAPGSTASSNLKADD